MDVYWENELIQAGKNKNTKIKKLTFVNNLFIFVENNKGTIHFTDVQKLKGIYTRACDDAGNEWRQVKHIHSREDLEETFRIGYSDAKKKRWDSIKLDTSVFYYKRVLSEFKNFKQLDNVLPWRRDNAGQDAELFSGLQKTCRCGYSFNNCKKGVIYEGLHQFDINSFYSYIMSNFYFPAAYQKVAREIAPFITYDKDKSFFAYCRIKVKKNDPFLLKFFGNVNDDRVYDGWVNNYDMVFLNELCGVEKFEIDPDRVWLVRLEKLPYQLTEIIEWAYQKKTEKPQEKKKYKAFLEMLYGYCIKQRYYPTHYEWNEEEQEMVEKQNDPFDYEDPEQKDACFKGHYQYGWGVWVLSYARLFLLRQKNKLIDAGFKVHYGDIDSLKLQGDKDAIVKELFTGKGEDIGQFKDEGTFTVFKALELKWYAGFLEDGSIKTACSGADKEVIERMIKNEGLESFVSTSCFKEGYNPLRKAIKRNGKIEVIHYGELIPYNNCPSFIIKGCAGCGKTTYIERKIKKLLEDTDEPITAITFTVNAANEMLNRIGHNPRLTICTIDSLTYQMLEGKVVGEDHEDRRRIATEFLKKFGEDFYPKSHLLVDEAQDLTLDQLNFIMSIPTLSRTFVGDPNQSIYQFNSSINIYTITFDCSTLMELSVNHRCKQNINDFAELQLNEWQRPHAKSVVEGLGKIEDVRELTQDIVAHYDLIICRTNAEVKYIKDHFPFCPNVMTIHKAKGLQAKRVLVIGVDGPPLDEAEQNVRYVAYSRAIDELGVFKGKIDALCR